MSILFKSKARKDFLKWSAEYSTTYMDVQMSTNKIYASRSSGKHEISIKSVAMDRTHLSTDFMGTNLAPGLMAHP